MSLANILTRITHKTSLKLTLSVSVPPFVTFAIEYKANLSKPENRIAKLVSDNKPCRCSR